MKKIMVVFGTRPEAIKMCPLILKLREKGANVYVCLTGQHREMLIDVMNVFNIKEDLNLEIMKDKQTLSYITESILNKMGEVLDKVNPDVVLVHGDTTTTFTTALAAFYKQIPVGHIEAGLRTNNIYSPYPEEFNRQAVSIISNFNFCPTELSKNNLENENRCNTNIYVTGNTVIDALKYTIKKDYKNEYLDWAKDSKLIILTAHRRENLGEPLKNICNAINRITKEFKDVKVIYPMHKNPVVRNIVEEILGGNKQVRLIEPLDVIDFHNFISRSYMVLTDSGGIQEEAPSLGKPVLVLRDTTERPEGVEAGTLKLVGTSEDKIFSETKTLLTNKDIYKNMSEKSNPYGDGRACERIAEAILKEK